MATTLTATWPAQLIAGAWQSVTISYAGSTPAASNPITASAGTMGQSPQAISGQLVSLTVQVPTTGTSVTFTDTASAATVTIPISSTPGTTRILAFTSYCGDTPDHVKIPFDPDNFITTFAGGGPGNATVDRMDTHANVGPPIGTPMIRNAPGQFFYYIADVAPAATYNYFFCQLLNSQLAVRGFYAVPTPPPSATPTGTPTATSPSFADALAMFRPGSATGVVCHAQAIENSPFVLLARVLDANGNPILPTAVASIAIDVWNVPDDVQTANLTATPANVISATLVVDPRWAADSIGFNLALPVPGTAIPTGDRTYRVEVTITPTAGAAFVLLWDVQCVGTFGA